MKPSGSLVGLTAILSVALVACGDGTEIVEVPGEPHAEILSFTVTPEVVEAGAEVTAQWATRHATAIELARNGTPVELGDASVTEGSITLTVDESTVFVIAAVGGTEVEPTMSAAVTVSAEPRPTIFAFAANPATVRSGETTTLEWQTRDTDIVRILDAEGVEIDLGGAVASEGSVTTEPLGATTTFKLIAERAGQPSSEKTITVRVQPLESPRIVSFEVDQPVVEEGGSAVLTWVAENAEQLQLFEGSDELDLGGQANEFGSVTVFPKGASNFRLVASKGDEQDERILLVRVSGFPVATLDVSPAAIDVGGEATLTWSSTDAETVTITDLEGRPLEGGPVELEGSRTIRPSISTTYVLTAVGATGNETRVTAVAGVNPAIATFEFVDDGEVGVGDLKALKWTTAAATRVEISNLEGVTRTFSGAEAAEGSASIATGAEGRFELIARSGRLSARQEISLPLMDAPAIGSFAADRDVVSLVDGQAIVRLAWSAVNRADGVELVDSNKGPVNLGSKSPVADFIDVAIEADTTFTLTAQNSSGTATAEVFVRAVPLPSVDSVVVWPEYAGPGETVDLTWTTTGATNVVIEANGLPLTGPFGPSDTLSTQVYIPTTFEVRAYNDALDVDSGTATVTIGQPLIDSFTPSASIAWEDSPVTFEWETRGAVSLSLSTAAGVEFSTTDRVEVHEGSFTTAPLPVGAYDYTLRIETAVGGVKSSTVRIQVASGPTIDAFVVGPPELLEGSDITVTWIASADPDGFDPTLELTDGSGGSYPLPAGASGTETFTMNAAGQYDFTLTATTTSPGSVPATSTASVTVYGVPTVTLQPDPTIFDDENHTGVELTWTSANADASLELFTVDDGGAATSLYQVPPAERAAGTFTAPFQTETTTYRIVATNGLGMVATEEVTVPMQGTQVLSFEATPGIIYPDPPAPPTIAVVAGDPVELTWTTKRATEVEIDVLEGFLIGQGAPYADIDGLPGVITLSPSSVDSGYAEITFPAGFEFEYLGTTYDKARVFVDGFISFEPGATTSASNYELPHVTYKRVHLAPFWDNMHMRTGSLLAGEVGGSYVIEWKGVSSYYGSNSPAGNDFDLNFQVVLHPDGSFEYRYGVMDPPPGPSPTYCEPDDCVAEANGSSATIGYQDPTGTFGYTLHFGATTYNSTASVPFPGGLANQSFLFSVPPPLPLSGTTTWTPEAVASVQTKTVTLTASGIGSESSSVDVEIHPRPTVVAAVELPAGQDNPTRNTPFTIAWTTENADEVWVEDSTGTARCTATSAMIASGSCGITESASGAHTYTVVAVGALGREVTADVEVTVVSADFGIVLFEALSDEVDYGQPVTLVWETGDADTLTITANGQPLTLPPTIDFESDSFTTPALTEETTFELTVTNVAFGSTASRTVTVPVRTFTFAFSGSAPEVAPGQPVTLTWSLGSLTGTPPTVEFIGFPMEEDTSGTAPFIDITGMPGVTALTLSTDDTGFVAHDFQNGFTFPFEGEDKTSVIVKADGFLSFATSSSTTGSNQILPHSTYPTVHLAPFWDDLHRRTGTLLAGPVGPDYVISWNGWSHYTGSTPTSYDLNFQVVLHPDGSFEYRYGTMNPPPGASTTSCYPNTCVNEANASSATIGYQMDGATNGFLLHYGGTSNGVNNTAFPGGLANRTFRYRPPSASGSLTFTPRETGTYRICAELGGFSECQTVEVVAEFLITSFDVSASEIEWGQTVDLDWVVKNGDEITITANGVEIATEATVPVDIGTISHGPTVDTTYLMTVKSLATGKTLTASKTVTVRQFSLDLTSSAAGQAVAPGSPVTLTWNATMLSGGSMVLTTPLEDVSATSTFTDISQDPGAVLIHGAGQDNQVVEHQFPAGFVFPYLGMNQSSVQISVNGFLSFDPSPGTQSSNYEIPNTSTTYRKVHIAPFWDNLYTRTNGRVHALQLDPDTFVVQWSHVSAIGSSNSNEYDLNFQVVLHSDGSFVYRYGVMNPLASGSSTSCHPNDCVNEANGSSATIGYQDPTGVAGFQLHFGGTSSADSNLPVAGGLSNRAWKFTPATGSGSVVIHPTDTTSYEICALSGTFVECSAPVFVAVPWGILSFAPDHAAVPLGTPVTLAWTTVGAESIELSAATGGTTTSLPVAALDPEEDTYVDTLSGTTTYTLTVNSLNRTKTATVEVAEQTVAVQSAASTTTVLPGESTTITWNVNPLGTGTPEMVLPMYEVTGTGTAFADMDISADPAAVQVIGTAAASTVTNHDFAGGFTFPFMGTTYSSVRVSADGYLSFDSSTTGSGTNQIIPNTSTTYRKMNLSVFWDDLNTRTGKVIAAPVGTDTYVVQWSGVSHTSGSSTTVSYDLNFMVVLHADGSFEYRYGTMNPPNPSPNSTACYPSTCENEANGSSATIGYQNTTGTLGSMLHFGGSSNGANNPTFPGGIANRTFLRPADSPTGSFTVSPVQTTTYSVCASLAGYTECKDVTIFVPAAGDVAITEMMLDPAGGPGEQWIELRNLSTGPVDIAGWTLETPTGSFLISQPLVLPPGGFATVAASNAVAFTPDLVWGTDLSLSPASGTLTLQAGSRPISSVTWGTSLTIPSATSLALDPSNHRQGILALDDPALWCPGTAAGSPGAVGDGCHPFYLVNYFSTRGAIDISGIGQGVPGITAFRTYGSATLSFPFPFYGATYTDISVTSSGLIAMVPSLAAAYYANDPLPSTTPPASHGVIAPFWADNSFSRHGATFQLAETTVGGQMVAVFQWTDLGPWNGPTSTKTTFQAQLWENGDIVFVYQEMTGDEKYSRGFEATVGIQEPATSGTPDALLFSYNQPIVTTGKVIEYIRK